MSAFFRRRVEETIEHMIALLDQIDGDPDLEDEPLEEQHDREAEDCLPPVFICADGLKGKRLS